MKEKQQKTEEKCVICNIIDGKDAIMVVSKSVS